MPNIMTRLWARFWRRIPRRRRRFWRYVSPHRKGAGVICLALLLGMVYGYWYLTNDGRVRAQAEQFLEQLTGGEVRIYDAKFSLFGDIELRNVRIFAPGQGTASPLFEAPRVVLRHRPWKLFATGRVQPTDILCMDPTVTIEYDAQTGSSSAQKMFSSAEWGGAGGEMSADDLPPIRIRRGRVVPIEIIGGLRKPGTATVWNMVMTPRDGHRYEISFEQHSDVAGDQTHGSLVLDLATGEVSDLKGVVPIKSLDDALPDKYRQWLARYGVTGKLLVEPVPGVAAGQAPLAATLEGFTVRLPDDEGGLRLTDVNGKIIFHKQTQTIEVGEITGRITQLPGARFTVRGHYGSYDSDGAFEIDLLARGLTLPAGKGLTGPVAEALAMAERLFRLRGSVDADIKLRRSKAGPVQVSGSVSPRGMSATLNDVPYRLDEVTGKIEFAGDRVTRIDLAARRDGARFTIRGNADAKLGGALEVGFRGSDMTFSEDLRRALPKEFRDVWDEVRPSGRFGTIVGIHRKRGQKGERIDVMLLLDGRASMRVREFPYPLEGVAGQIRFADNRAHLERVTARRGSMQCTIEGDWTHLDRRRPDMDLRIVAVQAPLDRALAEALAQAAGPAVTEAMAELGLAGTIRRATIKLTRRGDRPLRFDIKGKVSGVRFKSKAFPYEVSRAAGDVTIVPGLMTLEDLQGRHGQARITVGGEVFLGEKDFGVDLTIKAAGVAFDKDLLAASPPRAQRIWRELRPSGRADMELIVRHGTPTLGDRWDYKVVIRPSEMQVRPRSFPYALAGLTGQLVATPEAIVLKGIAARRGEMRLAMSGRIATTPDAGGSELAVRALNVPIDATLLEALPPELAPLAGRFKPGGTCQVDLRRLRFGPVGLDPPDPATRPAGPRPAGSVAAALTRPAVDDELLLEGTISVLDAVVDLGLSSKKLSGSFRGSIRQTRRGMAVNATVQFDSIFVGSRKLTHVRGRVVKPATSSLVSLRDLQAKTHGGTLVGFAEIRLVDPLEYGINISVEAIDLNSLLNAGVTDPKKRLKIEGLLTGKMHLRVTAGRPKTRQAVGQLRITRGKLVKLPVVLGLLNLVTLSLPSKSPYDEATVAYHLRGETLVFQEIYLRGSTGTLLGSGTMNMKDKKLNLTFLAGPAGKLPRISNLADEVLAAFARELLEIRVRGTITKPQTTTRTLGSIEEAIRILLNPGPPKRP